MTLASLSRVVGALLVSTSLVACTSLPFSGLDDRIAGHVAVLADDAMGGRDTGSAGYEMAANYVAGFYERVGVDPVGGSYRQMVPLKRIDTSAIGGSLAIVKNGRAMELVPGETVFVLPPSDGIGSYAAEAEGPLVFIGHGIHAPTLGIDDYEGVDVRGKIVVAFTGAPEIDDNPSAVHLRRFDVKWRAARERGAIGYIRVDPQDNMIKTFARFASRGAGSQISLGEGFAEPQPAALLGVEPLKTLFDAADRDFDDVLAAASAGENVSFDLGATARLVSMGEAAPIEAFNVVGVIPGTDPELAGEAVVLTAHLDHIGTRDDGDPETDDISNGALDNATGTAIIMEAARMLAADGGSRRTVIVAAVTAEEKGLLGAAHLARNIDALGYDAVANVNIDMPVLVYPLNDIIAFGAEYSSLGAHFDAAAAEVDLIATPDPLPELSLFVRSDHYRFVQEGIPALFLFNGMAGDGKENFQKFMATHYHKPSDDLRQPINWRDAAIFARLTYDLVGRIADADERPQWVEGTVFEKQEPQG